MTTIRTSTSARRSARGAAVALVAGAGIALTPLTAAASATAPPAAAPLDAAPAAAPAAASVAAPTHAAQVAVDAALAQQGDPYGWGATGPNAFDCSGLTTFAYRTAGVELPRTSRAQATAGVHVDRAHLQPGDLIFFYEPVSHVGMYVGNGQMVHSSTYGRPVAVVPVDSVGGYNDARRVV